MNTTSFDLETSTGTEEEQSGKLSIESVFYMILGCVGVLDNLFVIIIMLSYKPLRKNLTSIYIINQSLLDMMASLIFLASLDDRLHNRTFAGVAGDIYCKLWKAGTFQWTCYIASTYNLVAISLDRYTEVVHPIWHRVTITKRKALIIAVSIWLCSLTYCLVYNMPTTGMINGVCWAIAIWPSQIHSSVAGIINFIGIFFVPVCVMIYSYTRMALVLRSRVNPSEANQGNASATEKERTQKMAKIRINVIKTMALVCFVFFICWVCNQVWFLLYSARYPVNFNSRFYLFTIFCVYLNASVNPFIYILKYDQFKRGVKAVLFKKQFPDQATSTISTAGSTLNEEK